MASSLLLIPLLLVAAAVPHEANSLPAQLYYWSKVLPDTPMPAAIRDLLNPAEKMKATGSVKSRACSPVVYEKDMLSGAEITMDFSPTTSGAALLSRHAADSIPFSSIDPKSPEADSFKKTIAECEAPPVAGETKRCATSLESMVDFATSVLGTRRLSAHSTVVSPKGETSRVHKYGIVAPSGVKMLSSGGGSDVVACHGMKYPHAVFLCHKMEVGIRVYRVSAKAEDAGSTTAVEAVAVCHDNGVVGAPDACAVEPRADDALCHLLPSDHIIWTPKN